MSKVRRVGAPHHLPDLIKAHPDITARAAPDAVIRAVYRTSTSNNPDIVLPVWAESVARTVLESMSTGSGELQISIDYPGDDRTPNIKTEQGGPPNGLDGLFRAVFFLTITVFYLCPCDIAWLLDSPALLQRVVFHCHSVQSTEWISIHDADLEDLDC